MTSTRDPSLSMPPVQIPWDAINISLRWTDGRVTEMETTTFLNTLLREYQRTNLTLLNLYLDAAIRAHELAMLDQPKFVGLINYQGDTQ